METQYKTELLLFKTELKTDMPVELPEPWGVIRLEIILTQVYRTVQLLILAGLVLMAFWLVKVLKMHFAKKRVDNERVMRRSLEILAMASMAPEVKTVPSSRPLPARPRPLRTSEIFDV